MFQLIYVSTACIPMDETALRELLAQSREKNARLQITGMLLYQRRNFLQVLEGNYETVQSLLETIRRDKRHTNLSVVQEVDRPEREFANWTMAFHSIDESTAQLPGFSDYIDKPITGATFAADPGAAHNLLLFFKQITN